MEIKQLLTDLGRGKQRQIQDINSLIIHTTGYGKGVERIASKYKGDLKKVGEEYAKRMSSILQYKGHFLIDHTGAIYQFIPIDVVAYHTSSGNKGALSKDKNLPEWWKTRWQPLISTPLDLPCWRVSPNFNSVGVDLLAFGKHLPSTYTQEQYESLAWLYAHLRSSTIEIKFDERTILGHEDVHPIERNGWDPGPQFSWPKLLGLIKAISINTTYIL